MSWQLRRLADIPPTPWRNGGGVTRELVAWPDAQEWDWRISVAEVASSGPFSRFDGVRRWLAILDGAGVRLDFPSATVELTARDAPLAFSGEDPVECRLLGGTVQDLNLMLRARPTTRADASMRRVRGTLTANTQGAKCVGLYNPAAPALLRMDEFALAVPAATLAWRALDADAKITIEADHAIWMEW